MIRPVAIAVMLLVCVPLARAAEPVAIRAAYLHVPERKAAISLLDVPADDDGLAGAQLAMQDNNTTGKFLNQQFVLEDIRLKDNDDPKTAIATLADRGLSVVIADLPRNCCSMRPTPDARADFCCSTRAPSTTGCARRIAGPT